MDFLKKNLSWLVIVLLVLIPVLLWLGMMPLKFRFGSVISTCTSLGQLAALTGMVLFSWSLILSARLKFFDRYLGGLNRVYVNHHRIGAAAFVLLLFHPLFLTVRLGAHSLVMAAKFWLPSGNWALNFGLAALFGMMVLLILTFFVSLKYSAWKNTHKYLGAAFFLGGLHALMITSDISRNPILRYYMFTLALLGIAAYVYRTILGRWLVRRYLYVVDEIKNLGNSVAEISLLPLDANQAMSYTAGQFGFIHFNDIQVGKEQHPFSFVSAPSDRYIKFAIKNLGDYTSVLSRLSKGTVAQLEGPYGRFSFLNCKNKKQIWLAGGIGITPFVSMGLYLAGLPDAADYSIDLYYCVRDAAEMVLSTELTSVCQKCTDFRVISFCSNAQGFINAKFVSDTSNGLADKDIFLCGPPPMVKSLKEQFKQMGVSHNHIHSEEFSF